MNSLFRLRAPMALVNNAISSVKMMSTEVAKQVKMKHKVPQKRASKLLNELRAEEFTKLQNGRKFPQIRAGDSVEIQKLPYVTSKEADIVKGLVIGVTNRSSDTALKILNVEYGSPVYRRLVLYSPMIKDIKVLQKAFIHKGQKRVRRSKLYYLKDRHPDSYTVK